MKVKMIYWTLQIQQQIEKFLVGFSFLQHFLFIIELLFFYLVSKPANEHFDENTYKPLNVDGNIKTAPDGRLIIVDEPSVTLSKTRKFLNVFFYFKDVHICSKSYIFNCF